MSGPLHGVTVVEMAAIGPVPFCGMLLADLGADVIRIDRMRGSAGTLPAEMLATASRGRRSVAIDLKLPEGTATALQVVSGADVLLEGFRPGVMERLGLGPDVCAEHNPSLVYGRMTGWGQDGPYASMAGHDINYIGLTGALGAIGPDDRPPPPPLNLIGDYGGGSMYLAFGVLAALLERGTSGSGQVVDAAMVDGASSLMSIFYELQAIGYWEDRRGSNLLDGGAPFYRTYETADARYVAVGAIEPQFYAALVAGLEIDPVDLPHQLDRERWPEVAARLATVFRSRTLASWQEVFEGTDACVTPVLGMGEAPRHPHNAARQTFITRDGHVAPAPAPRFSRSRPVPGRRATTVGSHTHEVLADAGLGERRIADLLARGIVA